jgi:hypothetical protein
MSHITAGEFHALGLPYATIGEVGDMLDGVQKIVWEAITKNAARFLPRFEKIYERINGKNPIKNRIVVGKKTLRRILKELITLGFIIKIGRKRNTQGHFSGYVQYKATLPESLALNTSDTPPETPPEAAPTEPGQTGEGGRGLAIDTQGADEQATTEGLESAPCGEGAPTCASAEIVVKPQREAIITDPETRASIQSGRGANVGESDGVITKKKYINNNKKKSAARETHAAIPDHAPQKTPESPPERANLDTTVHLRSNRVGKQHNEVKPERSLCSEPGCKHRSIVTTATLQGPYYCDHHQPTVCQAQTPRRNGDAARASKGLRRKGNEVLQGMRRANAYRRSILQRVRGG